MIRYSHDRERVELTPLKTITIDGISFSAKIRGSNIRVYATKPVLNDLKLMCSGPAPLPFYMGDGDSFSAIVVRLLLSDNHLDMTVRRHY